MKQPVVLIIDDEPDIRELLEITLGRMGLDTLSAATVTQARRLLHHPAIALCLTDMKLPDGNGMDVIHYIQERRPETPVAMITAFGSMEMAIEALKAGAFDFITKPIDLERLRRLVESSLQLGSPASTDQDPGATLLGETRVMATLRRQIGRLARSQAPVFISGESGSGKEVVARLIHAQGGRATGPFVPVNCGAIPGELMESEFFGHVRGSFTGAHEDKVGLFEAADGGTLFLDEVVDLPLAMQVKLLRAIQEKAIRKVGSNQETPVDVRILSATHKQLDEEMEAGRFRSDLYYRIHVIELPVPALRQRVADIPLLARAFLERLAREWQLPPPELDEEALLALQNHDFPGNVRELENILERAFTLCEGHRIQVADLGLTDPSTGTPPLAPDPSAAFGNLDGYLARLERDALLAALDQTHWNRTSAANLLGLSFRQLRYRLDKLGLSNAADAEP